MSWVTALCMGTAMGLYIVGAVASAHRQWGSSGVNITVNVRALIIRIRVLGLLAVSIV